MAHVLNGRILPDEELVDIVNNLVEYPVPVAGNFDKEFLEVPDEVLINAMREHQKYFAVVDGNGDFTFVVQDATLDGQNKVVLSTPLASVPAVKSC